jgi:hypothetical protein
MYYKFNKENLTFEKTVRPILYNLIFSVIVAVLLGFYYETKIINTPEIIKEVVIYDTVNNLVVLKHGLTEINVQRGENIPTFCSNPGALRPSSIKEVSDLAIGYIQAPSGKFLYFHNSEHGFKALEIVLKKVYWNKTIEECIRRYAPSFENNTDGYISRLIKKLNVPPNTLVKNVNINDLMNAIADIEGFKGERL